MDIRDLKPLKYFIAFALVVCGFYVYSGIVGWRWFGSTPAEEDRTTHSGATGVRRYSHK